MKKKLIIFALFIISAITGTYAQEKQYKIGCVAFYNLENLFDTIDDPAIIDEEFLPGSANQWTSARYTEKLSHMADVISQIGTEMVPSGPGVLGVVEIENKQVLEDLVNTPQLKSRNYKIIHYNSIDARGIDVAFLYSPNYFTVTNSTTARVVVENDPKFKTRDVLLVSGIFDGEPMHFIVNHWPSRSGGEKRSAPLRNQAAKTARMLVDSLQKADKNAKIILMGDFNDEPTNASIYKFLNAKEEKENIPDGQLYNSMYEKYKAGIGTLAYRDSWSLFDQLIVSKPLLGNDKTTYKFHKSFVFNKSFLTQKEGRFEGYPLRTFAGGVYTNGYSDHFPVYMFLIKELNK